MHACAAFWLARSGPARFLPSHPASWPALLPHTRARAPLLLPSAATDAYAHAPTHAPTCPSPHHPAQGRALRAQAAALASELGLPEEDAWLEAAGLPGADGRVAALARSWRELGAALGELGEAQEADERDWFQVGGGPGFQAWGV